jgi:hypothetical protein
VTSRLSTRAHSRMQRSRRCGLATRTGPRHRLDPWPQPHAGAQVRSGVPTSRRGSRSVFLRAPSARCRAMGSSSRSAGYQRGSAVSSARRRLSRSLHSGLCFQPASSERPRRHCRRPIRCSIGSPDGYLGGAVVVVVGIGADPGDLQRHCRPSLRTTRWQSESE